MYFQKYNLPKTWLDYSLKSPVLKDPSTSKMVNCRKHFWNLNESSFTIFFHNCEGK